jgi:hypothetical protein
MASINDEINQLLAELDEDKINEIMDPKELNKLRKELNPYGRTIQGSDRVLTFSYTDLRKEYLIRLLTTTFIGYLNRACDEWHVPDGAVVIPVYEHLMDPSKFNTINSKLPEKDRKENEEWMEKRIIVKEFLEDLFQFNPDKHVRSAYRPNPEDPQRTEVLDTPAAKLAIEHQKKKNLDFANKMEQHELKSCNKAGSRRLKEKSKTAWQKAPKVCNPAPDAEPIKDEMLTKTVTEMIPSHDIFYRFKHYYDSNYEELRDAVEVLYCEKADLETAINPYDWHNSYEEADIFIKKHKNEVIAPIYPGYSGKWNFFGPFKNVREKTNYYNEHTIVLEEMMKQRQLDEELGKDLIKKRIKIKKQQNIKEAGDDDPAFKAWAKSNAKLKELGAIKEDDENEPDNAIEVPVIRVSQLKQSVEKTKFYSQAEAPEFVLEAQKSKQNPSSDT